MVWENRITDLVNRFISCLTSRYFFVEKHIKNTLNIDKTTKTQVMALMILTLIIFGDWSVIMNFHFEKIGLAVIWLLHTDLQQGIQRFW